MGSLLLLCSAIMVWQYHASKSRTRAEYVVLGFLVLRGAVALANGYYQFFPLARDAIVFDEVACVVGELLRSFRLVDLVLEIKDGRIIEPMYTVPLGFLYGVLGADPSVGFVANTIVFSLTSYNVYRISRVCFGSRGGMWGLVIYSVLPYSALHSTYLYRDPVVNFFLSQLFYMTLIWRRYTPGIRRWMVFGSVVIVSGFLRRENFVLICFIFYIFALHKEFSLIRAGRVPFRMVALVGVGVGAYVFISKLDTYPWLLREAAGLTDVDNIQYRLEKHLYDAQSSYLVDQRIAGFGDALRVLPLRVAYFYLSPFPWDMFKSEQVIPMIEAWVVGVITVFFVGGLLLLRKKRETRDFVVVALLFIAAGVCGASLVQSNSAGAQRHRTQFTWLVVAVGAPMIGVRRRRVVLGGGLVERTFGTPRIRARDIVVKGDGVVGRFRGRTENLGENRLLPPEYGVSWRCLRPRHQASARLSGSSKSKIG